MAGPYLIPTAMLAGSAAKRAVAAGKARLLAGGPVAFAAAEMASRGPNGAGIRKPVALKDLAEAELAKFAASPRPWAGFVLKRALIMGIVNVTPDSISDGGDYVETAAAVARGVVLAEAGADILDIGSIYFINEFPGPIRSGANDFIASQYGRDIQSFYINIWWPDIQQISHKYGIKYTGAFLETFLMTQSRHLLANSRKMKGIVILEV